MADTKISGVLLAGGLGRRMDGVDKGLQELRGRPLAAWVLQGLAAQVDEVLINANRNGERYAAFGYPVLPDRIAGFVGPLAGLHAALGTASHPLVLTVPCDSPFLPPDLASRLYAGLAAAGADIAIARTFDQVHPVFCLCRRELLVPLETYLLSGGRRAMGWWGERPAVEVAFDDEAAAFENINTRQELGRFAGGGSIPEGRE